MSANYVVRVMTSEEKEMQAVLEFRKKYFVPDTPLAAAVKLEKQNSERQNSSEWTATFEQGVSVLALDKHGELIGISINALIKREETNSNEPLPNTRANAIAQLFSHLHREDKMWENLPQNCDTVLEIRNCAVRTGWRGKGIMTTFFEESERIARSIGAGAVRIEAISAFVARAAEKCGFKLIYKLPYKDQTYIPQPGPPHLEVRVYIKEITIN